VILILSENLVEHDLGFMVGELFQIVAAIHDAGVEEGAWTTLTPALSRPMGEGVFGGARLRRALTDGFGLKGLSPHQSSFLGHAGD